jgi:predicted CoA-substrate-specific enzyme activase
MITAGIDAGSRAIKVALYDAGRCKMIGAGVVDQGVEQAGLAQCLFDKIVEQSGLQRGDVRHVVATGYGRSLVRGADTTITEITCHAAGVRHGVKDAATVIDIGGQDSKVIWIGANGKVRDFEMNDRCAAGTGRFLEMVASRLGLRLDEIGEMARRSAQPAVISSMCAVFAETEIVGLLASGVSREDIVGGVQASISRRIAGMAGRSVEPPVVFTGGVAMVPGMDAALGEVLGCSVQVAAQPQMTGALGAAILATAVASSQ